MENAKLTFRNGDIKIGDVLVSSWGYEQTNVDFFQVIKLKGKKTIVVKEINKDIVEYGSSLSGKVRARLNDFLNEKTYTRQVKEYSDRPFIAISDYSNAYLAKASEKFFFSNTY